MASRDLNRPPVSFSERARLLEARWQKLCANYLPRASAESMWRSSRPSAHQLPRAGWKLHISATILNAPAVLERVAPFLIARGIDFKAPRSLADVQKLNAGLDESYSQVGKIFTIYPPDDREAVLLAQQLHRMTTRFKAPAVPFDIPFGERSNVYYRFGAFEHLEIEHQGKKTLATYNASGDVVPDLREVPKPDWAVDPFQNCYPVCRKPISHTSQTIRVVQALAQRGKGGVYVAIDFSGDSPKPCLLKEGRKNGEVSWDGRDGAWRIRNEARVLAQLAKAGVTVPAVRSRFESEENYYVVMDYLDGETLHRLLGRRRRRLPLVRAVDFSLQLAALLAQMHATGWVWRDCKPNNIVVTRAGRLVPIDFEGATLIARPDRSQWGTPGFTPPEWRKLTPSHVGDDLYALGSMLYLLLTGKIYQSDKPEAIETLRRKVPRELRELTELLLSSKRHKRPSAEYASRILRAILLKLRAPANELRDSKAD